MKRFAKLTPRVRQSVFIACSMALVTAIYQLDRFQPSDFAQLWAAARVWSGGGNPYASVGPGLQFDWPFPLLYPMTAVLAALPLAWLPLTIADPVFVALGAAAFAWAVTRERLDDPRLLVFVSAAGALVIQTSQWSPLLCAAALIPVLAPLLACKPTLGLALLIAYPSVRALLGIVGFGVVSLVAWPSWPLDWLQALPAAGHMVAPVGRPGGVLVLAVLIRWRQPEARLLAAMACMPQTPELYEAVPFFLIPRTWVESAALVLLTVVTAVGHRLTGPYTSYDSYMTAGGTWMLWVIYIPCTIWVLSRGRSKNSAGARSQFGESNTEWTESRLENR